MVVCVGMVHQLAAAVYDGLGLLRILVRPVADHEKGRLDAVVREYIQDLLRVVRPPCGIKGNAAHLLIAFHAVDGQLRVATDARTAAGAFTAPKMAAAASSAAPTVSVLRRRTRNRGRGASLFPRFSLRLKYKNIRISSPFYFGGGYAIIFSFMPWTLCTSFGFF